MARPRPDASGFGRMLVALMPLTTAVVVLAYLVALFIALPLNLLGIMRVEYCVIPLFIGGLTLPFVLFGELNAA